LRLDEALNNVIVMASFRKYLHSIRANETLSFWLEAGNSPDNIPFSHLIEHAIELYSMVSLAQREKRAQEIFNKYFEESSEYYLYVDNFDVEVGIFETEFERV
jgi:hypothetical protein